MMNESQDDLDCYVTKMSKVTTPVRRLREQSYTEQTITKSDFAFSSVICRITSNFILCLEVTMVTRDFAVFVRPTFRMYILF